jgi:hypothetical protein
MLNSTIKHLKTCLKNSEKDPFLYSDEEIAFIKKQLRQFRDLNRMNVLSQMNGFGTEYENLSNKYAKQLSQPSERDSRSGEDDGVRSESIEPVESEEPECSGTTEVLHQA